MTAASIASKIKSMVDSKNGSGLWLRILVPVFGLAVAGALAFGALRAEVTHLEEDQPTIHQNETDIAVLQVKLDAMDGKLDRILEQTRSKGD